MLSSQRPAAPTMAATKTPQAAATTTSRRRPLTRTGWSVDTVFIAKRSDSQRSVEHAGAELDDGHDVEQERERAERKADGDRARAAAPLLLLAEHDPVVGGPLVHDLTSTHAAVRLNAALKASTSSAAKRTTRYRIEKAKRCLAGRSPAAPRSLCTRQASATIMAPAATATAA